MDTLGDVIANFKESRLVVRIDGAWVTLWGDPDLCYGGVALRSALDSLQAGGEGFLVQLWLMATALSAEGGIPEEILQVLEENK